MITQQTIKTQITRYNISFCNRFFVVKANKPVFTFKDDEVTCMDQEFILGFPKELKVNSYVHFNINNFDTVYHIRDIKEDIENMQYTFIEETKNITTKFIVPLILDNIEEELFLVNAYLSTTDYILVLKYKFFNLPEFNKIEDKLIEFPLTLSIIPEHNTCTNIIVLVKIPNELKGTIELIKQGKYSKISNSYKNKILDYYGVGINSDIYDVLYKTDNYRKSLSKILDYDINKDSELYDIMTLENETVHLDKILSTIFTVQDIIKFFML